MSIKEVKEIREQQSLEAAHLTGKALRDYFDKGANELQQKIEALRKEKEMKKEQSKKVTV